MVIMHVTVTLDSDELAHWKDHNRGESLSAFLRAAIFRQNHANESLEARLEKLSRVYSDMESSDSLQAALENWAKGIEEAYHVSLTPVALHSILKEKAKVKAQTP